MPALSLKILPLPVPETVSVKLPGAEDPVEIPVEELDDGTLAELLEEFTAAFMQRAGR